MENFTKVLILKLFFYQFFLLMCYTAFLSVFNWLILTYNFYFLETIVSIDYLNNFMFYGFLAIVLFIPNLYIITKIDKLELEK